jgi:hypothetical protein
MTIYGIAYMLATRIGPGKEPHHVPCTGAVYTDGDITFYPPDPAGDITITNTAGDRVILTRDEYERIMKHLEESE